MTSICNGFFNFHTGYFDYRGTFRKVLDSTAVSYNRLNVYDTVDTSLFRQ